MKHKEYIVLFLLWNYKNKMLKTVLNGTALDSNQLQSVGNSIKTNLMISPTNCTRQRDD
jgi:hypothetical protein